MKRILSVVLAIVMIISLLPMASISVSASDADDIVSIARGQIGSYGSDTNKFTSWYYGKTTSAAWCAIFVSWCANQTGVLGNAIPKRASCASMLEWFQNRGEYYSVSSSYIPQKGDIIFFDTDGSGVTHHVEIVAQSGFITENGKKKVRCVGGNTSNANFSGSDYVSEKNRYIYQSSCKVMGYAHPSYDDTADYSNYTYSFNFNANGGTLGSSGAFDVSFGEQFQVVNTTCTRSGYTWAGWNVKRNNDNKWYVDGQGWCTESQISSNGYIKKVYPNYKTLTFDDSWTSGITGNCSYTFYAIWIQSRVDTLKVFLSPYGEGYDHITAQNNLSTSGFAQEKIYAWYILFDGNTGALMNTYSNKTYSVELTVYDPNGETLYSYTYADSSDANWIGVTPQMSGTYTATATISGAYSGSLSTTYEVSYDTQISSSHDSISLNLNGTNNVTPTVYIAGNHPGKYGVKYQFDDNSIASAAWTGNWDGNSTTIAVTGKKYGSTNLTISVYENYTGNKNVVDSIVIPVYVSANSYTVSYNANGGSGAPSSQTKYYGTNISLSSTVPTRSGYTFLGWSTSSTATSAMYQPGSTFSANADTTLYAVWKANPSSLSINSSNSAVISTGGEMRYYTFIPSTSYTNVIYSTGSDDTMVYLYDASGNELANNDDGGENHNFRLEYNFTAGMKYTFGVKYYNTSKTGTISFAFGNVYTISYNANGGSGAPSTQKKDYGANITFSSTIPTRIGYTFKGWASFSSATSSAYQPGATYTSNIDTTLYAVWQANTYTVRYNSNGGSGAMSNSTHTYDASKALSSNAFTRSGYTFLGWATSGSATSATYTNGQSVKNLTSTNGATVNLYAVWSKIPTYTISYNANGGSGAPSSQTKNHGQSLTLSTTAPSRPGYKFKGWATSSTATTANYQPGASFTTNADITLYAVWEYKEYPVWFYANLGTGAPEHQVKLHDEPLILPDTKPTRQGYAFLGWSTDTDATSAMYQPGGTYAANSSISLYAVWQKKTVSSISISCLPTKTVYYVGDDLDTSGLKIKVTYTDGTYEDITSGNGLGMNYNMTIVGIRTVNVKFEGKSTTFNITIKSPTISLSETTKTIIVDDTAAIIATTDPTGQTITWSSSNTNVATVVNGVVTAKGEGTTTITAKFTYNGKEYSETCDVTVAATTYTVSYNANGGSGAPGNQTKTKDVDLTLSSTVPTRNGYTFKGWATSSSATSATYQPGGTYSSNANITLYAVWESRPKTVIRLYVNGGDDSYSEITVDYDETPVLPSIYPTRAGYTFKGWAISRTATTPTYQPGASLPANTNMNLYAVWQENPIALSANSVNEAVITTGAEMKYFTYTPTVSGTYVIYSTGTDDTKVYLYSANETELDNNDDGGDDNNFRLQYNLTAGTKYTFGVRYYSSSKTGTISFKFGNVYTITYNANDGIGAPSAQSKDYGADLTLSSTIPTRAGYMFKGWATGSSATTPNYQPGEILTTNANTTLYAVWEYITVSRIAIQTNPTKTTYWIGESLDTTGLTLTASYSDGSSKTVSSGFTVSGFNSTTDGTKTVTVTYGEETTTFTVTVKTPTLTGITVKSKPTKTTYWIGESLDTTGLTLTASYSDGSSKTVSSGFTVSGYSSTTAGTKTVTVTYGEETTTFTVTVKTPTLTGITVKSNPTKTIYWIGESLDTTGLTLTASYSDGSSKTVSSGFTVSGYSSTTAGTKTVTVTYEGKTTTFVVTVLAPVTNGISKQPAASTTGSGVEVTFKVEVTGDTVSYKWQYRKLYKWFDTTMTGYNTDTLTVTATGARNGYDYRCVITFADGTVLTTEPAELTVNTYITDIQNPNDQTAVLGNKGQFTASAVGEGIKYQWQYCRPGSEKWINTTMEGCTKATLFVETTAARNGYQYRCIITDVTGQTVYTEAATLRVMSITKHPESIAAAADETVQFAVKVNITEGVTYQWQYRRSATGNWTNTSLTGYNTATLTVPAKGKNGYEYRCIITGAKNSRLESNAATLTVGTVQPEKPPVEEPAGPVVTTQPENATVLVGGNACFTAKATGAVSYKWQYRRSTTGSWTSTTMSGYSTDTLTVGATAARNGYQYRCVITGEDGSKVYTNVAILTVSKIEAQTEAAYGFIGSNAKLTVGLTAAAEMKYQWKYRRSNTGNWSGTTMTGYNTEVLTVAVTAARDGYQYRCVMTDSFGNTLVSEAITLSVVKIAQQPASQIASAGNTATFSVALSEPGVEVTYQWQYARAGSDVWYNTSMEGATTASLKVQAIASRNGYQYRCVIRGLDGTVYYSDPATLTVN